MRGRAERHPRLTCEAGDADGDVDRLAGFDLRQHRQRGGGRDALTGHRVGLLQRLLSLVQLRAQIVDLSLLTRQRL